MKHLLMSITMLFGFMNTVQAVTLAEILQASIDQDAPVELICELASSGEKVSFEIAAELSAASQLGQRVTYDQVLVNPFIGGFSISGDHLHGKKYGGPYFDVENGELVRITFDHRHQSPIHVSSNPLKIERLFITPSSTNRASTTSGYTYINCSTSID